MTRRVRIIRNTAIALVAVVLALVIAGIAILNSDWFSNYARQEIIAATERSTGGRVELESFVFDWRRLRAVLTNFVIHGTEPRDAAPFLRVPRITVDLRLLPSLHHLMDIAYLGVDRPEANIVVGPDGRSNIPTPKQSGGGNQSPLQPVVDAAIGHFELNNGTVMFASGPQQLNIRGNDLHAALWFNSMLRSYSGSLAFEPLYVASGKNNPVKFTLTIPLKLESDRVELQNASLTTPDTSIQISGSAENLRDPKVALHVNGHVAFTDLRNAAGLAAAPLKPGAPSVADIDANGSISSNRIEVIGLRVRAGHSNLEASSDRSGSIEFKSTLDLAELGSLIPNTLRPAGMLTLNGSARVNSGQNYSVNGNVQARDLSFTQDSERIRGLDVFSALHLDSHSLDLSGLRLSALGGELAGNFKLEDFARFQFHGDLRRLDLQSIARVAGVNHLRYDGSLSGPLNVRGDIKAKPVQRSVTAEAKLTVAPGNRGIPISGRLAADYDGAAGNLRIDNSQISLPHTHLELNGSLRNQLNVSLSTSNVNDLLAAVPGAVESPVNLNGHTATFQGTVSGALTAPRISGHLQANHFSVEDREFTSLTADLAVAKDGASISAAEITRGAMDARVAGQVGLRNWRVTPDDTITIQAAIQKGDLGDILALAGQSARNYSGALSATLHLNGTVGNPTGAANVLVTNGAIYDQPFDRIEGQVEFADQAISIPSATIIAGAGRATLSAEYNHARDSLATGQLHARIQSSQINLAQLASLQKKRPNTAGILEFTGDVTAKVESSKFNISTVNGGLSARGLQFDGEKYGDLSATAQTSGQAIHYQLTSNFAGSDIRVTGATQLTSDYLTTLDAEIRKLPIDRMLAVAQRTDIPAKGLLSGTVHFTGTEDHPQGNVELDLANAVLYDEPIDHLHIQSSYQAKTLNVSQLEISASGARIDLSGRYDHPEGNLDRGQLQFQIKSSGLDLARIHNVQSRRPGLAGTVEIDASGSAEIQQADPRVLVKNLKGTLAAKQIVVEGKDYGNLNVNAHTENGRLSFELASNLAGSSIQGRGTAQLNDHYPVDAELAFNKLSWSKIRPLVVTENGAAALFEAEADGRLQIRGPILEPENLKGSFEISNLEASSIPARGRRPVVLKNAGPITAAIDHQAIRIDAAHITGPQTDIQMKGTFSLADQSMDLAVNANVDLGLLQNFDEEITSSGSVIVAANIRGTASNPLLNGKLEIRNGSMNYAEFPNGISNANGVVTFNGSSASVRDLTAQSGGGTLTVGGFVILTGNRRFGLHATASSVRIRMQQDASIVTDGNFNLTGTEGATRLSGTATINRIAYSPKTDLGSLLARTAPPVQAPGASPLLDKVHLDIHVQSSDALSVESSLAQSLEGQVDLRIRGTASHPGVVGRVTLTEGTLTFFGSSYTVNSGTIAFYNPVRVEPILDINLETHAQGVTVTLRVTGPVDNMKLSYTSDPPLQFQEIVSLLAAGRTPTSDPTLLANQPSQPPQSYQQMGESAILGKALVDPVATRLQRVFGVSQLKIDPTFTNGSQLPQAQLTLQQQIASNITFTYVSSVDNANAQTIQIQVILNSQWSALATRDQNGIFSINLLYKRQIR